MYRNYYFLSNKKATLKQRNILIKMGANVPSTQEDLNNQPLIRRRLNGAVSTKKVPEADDDASSKYYVDVLGNAILEGLDSIITSQNELLGG